MVHGGLFREQADASYGAIPGVQQVACVLPPSRELHTRTCLVKPQLVLVLVLLMSLDRCCTSDKLQSSCDLTVLGN